MENTAIISPTNDEIINMKLDIILQMMKTSSITAINPMRVFYETYISRFVDDNTRKNTVKKLRSLTAESIESIYNTLKENPSVVNENFLENNKYYKGNMISTGLSRLSKFLSVPMGGGQNVDESLLANPEKIAEPVGVNDILSE